MIDYLHALLPIITFIINVISQVCICRYVTRISLLKSLYIGFAIGLCSLISAELYYLTQASLFFSANIGSILVNIITYSALGYGYFHFVNLGETARRIRILRELYDSKGGLSMKGILAKYDAGQIVNNGQIIFNDGKYYIGSPLMLWIAKIIVKMKLIILGKKSEFD